MNNNIDYSEYSTEQLLEVQKYIKEDSHPENYKALMAELESRKDEIDSLNNNDEYIKHEPCKLPILKIFQDVIELTQDNLMTLFKVSIPLLLTYAASFSTMYFLNNNMLGNGNFNQPDFDSFYTFIIPMLGFFFFFIVTYTMAIVGWHRIYLKNSFEQLDETQILRWSWRELRFIGWTILIGLGSAFIALPIMCFMMFGMVAIMAPLSFALNGTAPEGLSMFAPILMLIIMPLFYLPIAYIVARWSLILPEVAVSDNPVSFSLAWDLSRNNGWRLVFLIGIISFIVNIFLAIINLFLPQWASIVFSMLTSVIFVMEVGLLSVSFDYLFKHRNKMLEAELDDIKL